MKGQADVGKIKNIEVTITDQDDKKMIYKVGSDGNPVHLTIEYNMETEDVYFGSLSPVMTHPTSRSIKFLVNY